MVHRREQNERRNKSYLYPYPSLHLPLGIVCAGRAQIDVNGADSSKKRIQHMQQADSEGCHDVTFAWVNMVSLYSQPFL